MNFYSGVWIVVAIGLIHVQSMPLSLVLKSSKQEKAQYLTSIFPLRYQSATAQECEDYPSRLACRYSYKNFIQKIKSYNPNKSSPKASISKKSLILQKIQEQDISSKGIQIAYNPSKYVYENNTNSKQFPQKPSTPKESVILQKIQEQETSNKSIPIPYKPSNYEYDNNTNSKHFFEKPSISEDSGILQKILEQQMSSTSSPIITPNPPIAPKTIPYKPSNYEYDNNANPQFSLKPSSSKESVILQKIQQQEKRPTIIPISYTPSNYTSHYNNTIINITNEDKINPKPTTSQQKTITVKTTYTYAYTKVPINMTENSDISVESQSKYNETAYYFNSTNIDDALAQYHYENNKELAMATDQGLGNVPTEQYSTTSIASENLTSSTDLENLQTPYSIESNKELPSTKSEPHPHTLNFDDDFFDKDGDIYNPVPDSSSKDINLYRNRTPELIGLPIYIKNPQLDPVKALLNL